jgi:ATP-dependent DNA helicase RecQ
VVSPLISLMVDQVTRLNELGIPAACLHSQVSAAVRADSLRAAAAGELRFLYLAPERIGAVGFLDSLSRLTVERFVVDEAHCISSWGHDFRPEYRRLGEAIAACGRPPVGAFTATATPRVRADITTSLGLHTPIERVTGFVRDNLTMSVIRCRGVAEKRDAVLRLVRPGGGRALVYCGSRRTTDAITEVLARAGVSVASYHGALDGETRQSVHEGFAAGRLQAIVATSAFGMGVDFPDIRRVIHHDFPGSLEEYYQQAGRAGRDGEPSECTLLYNAADRQLQEFFIEQAYPERDVVRNVYRELLREGSDSIDDWDARGVGANPARAALELLRRADVIQPDGSINRLTGAPVDFEEQALLKANAYARVTQVMDYAISRSCRHARIADYFGEQGVARTCRACDNCLDPDGSVVAAVDPADVVAALTCIARFDGHLGGVRIASILRGANDAWTASRSWVTELAFFGALRNWDVDRIRDLLERLVELDCVTRGHGEKPTLGITQRGRAVLSGESTIEVEVRPTRTRSSSRGRKQSGSAPLEELSPDISARFEALRRWRLEVARSSEVPPYVVFHDKTLVEIARRNPKSGAMLVLIAGVGPTKLARYGSDVLSVLRADE